MRAGMAGEGYHERIARIVERLMCARPDDADKVIGESLAEVALLFDAQRAVRAELDGRSATLVPTHVWEASKADPRGHAIVAAIGPGATWAQRVLAAGGNVIVSDVAQLPGEADGERRLALARGVVGFLYVPVGCSAGLVVGLERVGRPRPWSSAAADLLRIVGAATLGCRPLQHRVASNTFFARSIQNSVPPSRHGSGSPDLPRAAVAGESAPSSTASSGRDPAADGPGGSRARQEIQAAIAYEVNQPLASIIAFGAAVTERLERAGVEPSIVGAVHRMSDEARRASSMLSRPSLLADRAAGGADPDPAQAVAASAGGEPGSRGGGS